MAGELILVVEDNERNLKLVRDVLGYAGFRIAEAGDAETALALARELVPDLILMDLQLPGMGGEEAMERLRAMPETARIPIAALTAHAMKDDSERFLRAGFDGYLEKPISVRDLPRQVGELIAARHVRAAR